ncbi:MAG: hypothetical protein H7338_20460 [Candidatus Sericytochromatia bacterium]|nr:hypothetical protein [Candidatus Sericytochromatia bacterium]
MPPVRAAERMVYTQPLPRMTGLIAGILVLTCLGGCWWSSPPPPPAAPIADDGRRQGTLAIAVRAGGQPVAGALVDVSGDGLKAQKTQETGEDGALGVIGIDPSDDLVIRAEAPGFLPVTKTTEQTDLAAVGRSVVLLELLPATGILTGRVVSQGRPLAGACVSDGQRSTLTDSAGHFRLAVGDTYTTLRMAATGYVAQNLGPINVPAATDLGDQSLVPVGRLPHILVDLSRRSFGRDGDAGELAGLYALLTGRGYRVSRLQDGPLGDLGGVDIVVVPVMSTGLASDERDRLVAWVRQGGKLIVLGEWGGFGGFNLQAANDLLLPFNLGFGGDALRSPDSGRERPGAIPLPAGTAPGLWDGVRQVDLFEACRVRVREGGKVPLDSHNTYQTGRLGQQGMRVAAVWGNFSPIGVSLLGAGRVVAIGDASLWSGDDSDGDGTLNLFQGDNRTFALNVFRW